MQHGLFSKEDAERWLEQNGKLPGAASSRKFASAKQTSGRKRSRASNAGEDIEKREAAKRPAKRKKVSKAKRDVAFESSDDDDGGSSDEAPPPASSRSKKKEAPPSDAAKVGGVSASSRGKARPAQKAAKKAEKAHKAGAAVDRAGPSREKSDTAPVKCPRATEAAPNGAAHDAGVSDSDDEPLATKRVAASGENSLAVQRVKVAAAPSEAALNGAAGAAAPPSVSANGSQEAAAAAAQVALREVPPAVLESAGVSDGGGAEAGKPAPVAAATAAADEDDDDDDFQLAQPRAR